MIKQLICPVSSERVDENRVRFTALWVVLIMGAYFLTGYALIPALVALDFAIRAFGKPQYSALSWLAGIAVNAVGTKEVLIDKAPKMFAARIGFLLTSVTAILTLIGFQVAAIITAAVLVGFAFLECGLNFCAGCWVYTYVVYPLVRRR